MSTPVIPTDRIANSSVIFDEHKDSCLPLNISDLKSRLSTQIKPLFTNSSTPKQAKVYIYVNNIDNCNELDFMFSVIQSKVNASCEAVRACVITTATAVNNWCSYTCDCVGPECPLAWIVTKTVTGNDGNVAQICDMAIIK